MSRASILFLLLLVAACHDPETRKKIREMENQPAEQSNAAVGNDAQPQ
jgi:hypothetical protein